MSEPFDCTSRALPAGITLAPSPGKGLGLFAARAYTKGEQVFRFRAALYAADAVVQALTDYGPREVSVRKHGSGPVKIDYVALAPDAQLDQLAALIGVDAVARRDKLAAVWRRITHDGRDVYFLTDFDAFMNHAYAPNCVYGPRVLAIELWRGRVAGWYETLALGDIAAGEELTVDYRTFKISPPPR